MGVRSTSIVVLTAAVLAVSAPSALAADPVIAAVGDLGCGPSDPAYMRGAGTATDCRQQYVSDLLVAADPAAALLLGDTQYDLGQLSNFNTVFGPTYGRVNPVAYPVPGNVEYGNGITDGSGFFTYFGEAGVLQRIANSGNGVHVSQGYYSFDVGTWHIIGLNSNCTSPGVGGCGPGSPQEAWLRADLAANPNKCILAFAHHARWNSGPTGNDGGQATFWTDLYNAHADLFLNGHSDHHYERHAPQNPDGTPDPNGIREFIVSTGGEHHGIPPATPGNANTLQVANYTRFGILKLTLHARSYDWQFVPEEGTTPPPAGPDFSDSGSDDCHPSQIIIPPPPPPPVDMAATELNVARARIVRSRRTLELDGPISSQATGRIRVVLSAAGLRTKRSAPIRSHRFRIRAKIPAAQARLGTGLVTISYAGDARTRPLTVRLRAAAKRARLKPRRPTLVNGRLRASGTVARRARGVVQVLLEYRFSGTTTTLRFRAKINHGEWKLDTKPSQSAQSQINLRSGTLHSYILYGGSRAGRISGELRSFRVL